MDRLDSLRASGPLALARMIRHCGPQIFACVNDPECKAALDCLQACSPTDQVLLADPCKSPGHVGADLIRTIARSCQWMSTLTHERQLAFRLPERRSVTAHHGSSVRSQGIKLVITQAHFESPLTAVHAPQVCSYRCIVSHESQLLEDFSLCILQKHNCLGKSAEIPALPDPPPMASFRGENLTHDLAESLFIGWLGVPASPFISRPFFARHLPWRRSGHNSGIAGRMARWFVTKPCMHGPTTLRSLLCGHDQEQAVQVRRSGAGE